MLNLKNNYFVIFLIFFTILSNYIFLLLELNSIIKINFLIFLISIIYYFTFIDRNLTLIIFFIAITVISLGSLNDFWDARSIWLYKAKFIFFENSVLKLNQQPYFSHPDYPNIGPAFAATFAKILNTWKEVFPKTGLTFLFFPPLIILSIYFSNNYLYLLLISCLFVIGKYFVNGEMDGLVSIYLCSSIILLFEILKKNNDKINFWSYLILLNSIIILSLLKVEGTIIAFIIVFTSIFHLQINQIKNRKLSLILIMSICPSLLWHIYTLSMDMFNMNTEYAYNIDSFSNRIADLSNYFFITKFIILNEKFMFSLAIYLISFYFLKNKKLFNFISFTVITYVIVLYIVYFSTPLDIEFHLSSSANRVIKPLALLLLITGIYNKAQNSRINGGSDPI